MKVNETLVKSSAVLGIMLFPAFESTSVTQMNLPLEKQSFGLLDEIPKLSNIDSPSLNYSMHSEERITTKTYKDEEKAEILHSFSHSITNTKPISAEYQEAIDDLVYDLYC